jgi:hypothetical protein
MRDIGGIHGLDATGEHGVAKPSFVIGGWHPYGGAMQTISMSVSSVIRNYRATIWCCTVPSLFLMSSDAPIRQSHAAPERDAGAWLIPGLGDGHGQSFSIYH